MKLIREIITLHAETNLSIRKISKSLSVSRSTIADYISRYKSSALSLKGLQALDDRTIYERLFPNTEQAKVSKKAMPDFAYVHKELKRKGVSRMLLWEEYREQHPTGYGYSQFCELFRQSNKRVAVTMRQIHKAGEKMFVDYSGLTMFISDEKTGKKRPVEIFVACLGASGYSFAIASESQNKSCFINAHTAAYEFFKGVSEITVPDNLKSAVTKPDLYAPQINQSYQDMANHYGTVIIPARPYKPKDKAKVELSVKLVQRWILAKLRNRQFFDIAELNAAIRPLLDELNNRKIKLLGKTRRELYEELDAPALKHLPSTRYSYREYKICRVKVDYHIQLEKCAYSVPHHLVGKEVEVRYSNSTVEVVYQNKRVAVHHRLFRAGACSTKEGHMPEAHKKYAQWTVSRLLAWASGFGVNTKKLIEGILSNSPHSEIGIRRCLGILNRAKGQDKEIVEAVSQKMLELNIFRVDSFSSILKHKTYGKHSPVSASTPEGEHANIRGEGYYWTGANNA